MWINQSEVLRRNFNYLVLSRSAVTVSFWICAWLIFLWKYTSFKPHHMFLASELIKNLYTAKFAFMLMKSSVLLHEAASDPFSTRKHILIIFWDWKSLFSNHIEAEQEIHHACKKECNATQNQQLRQATDDTIARPQPGNFRKVHYHKRL